MIEWGRCRYVVYDVMKWHVTWDGTYLLLDLIFVLPHFFHRFLVLIWILPCLLEIDGCQWCSIFISRQNDAFLKVGDTSEKVRNTLAWLASKSKTSEVALLTKVLDDRCDEVIMILHYLMITYSFLGRTKVDATTLFKNHDLVKKIVDIIGCLWRMISSLSDDASIPDRKMQW